MDKQYIIALIWLAGFLLCRWMLKVEHESEKREYTNGNQVATVILSILSFAMVLFIMVNTWVKKVGETGYWKRPVKNKKAE